MWIKRSLVIVPIGLLAFLIQSVFWVPNTGSAADNESRQNRIIFYMGGDPADMNPWSSTTTTDSTVTQYLYEGLLRYNKDYIIEPWLAEYCTIHHEVTAPVPPGMAVEEFEAWVRDQYGDTIKEFEKQSDAGTTPKFVDIETGKEVNGPSSAEKVGEFIQPAMVRVLLKASPRQEQIVSAVQPEFGREVYGRHLERLLVLHGDADYGDIDEKKMEAIAKALEIKPLNHEPIVEMRMKQGIHWTDGPFFSEPDRTFQMKIDGEAAGIQVADSAEEAVRIVRERHDAGKDASITATKFDKRFGDEEEGPWWGRGPEVTARDPKITFDLIRNPDFASPRYSSWLDVKDVRLDDSDPYKIEVVYKKLYSPALSNLVGDIIPYHMWNTTAWTDEAIRKERGPRDLSIDPDDYNVMRQLPKEERDYRHRPASMGSMVLEPLNGQSRPLWRSAEMVRLRRNEFYWGRKPEFQFMDYLIFDPALGRETSEIAFLAGNMDIYTARNFQVERYKAMADKYYVFERETTTYTYIGFNCRKGALANKRVRLALSMAVDIEMIMQYVLYDQGQRIAGPAYPVLPWYNREYRREHTWLSGPKKGQTEMLEFIPYNLDEAEAILAEEGYTRDSSGTLTKDGEAFTIRFINSSGGGERQDIATLARENWKKLGVRVDYKEYEWNVFISQYVMAGNFDALVLGWSGGLNFDKRQLFHSKYEPTMGMNFVGYSNPEADRLMDKILTVYDPDEQVRLSHEIFNFVADDCPYLFIYSPFSTSVMDKRIVWREKVGEKPDGTPTLESRPVDHEHITGAKAALSFFVTEFKRLEEQPDFTEADRKR